jgi:hypothetical protein
LFERKFWRIFVFGSVFIGANRHSDWIDFGGMGCGFQREEDINLNLVFCNCGYIILTFKRKFMGKILKKN